MNGPKSTGKWSAPLAGLLTAVVIAGAGCREPSEVAAKPVEPAPVAAPAADAKAKPARAPGETVAREPATTNDTVREAADNQTAPDAAPPSSHAQSRPVSVRPRADREFTTDGVEKITFDDLILGMQPDMVFRPWMLEANARTKELEGKRIRLPGVMYGGLDSGKKNKEFVLLRNQECKFGPGGQADHVAQVLMKDGKTVGYTSDTVRVEGTLRITPSTGDDGNTWYIYTIEDAELK